MPRSLFSKSVLVLVTCLVLAGCKSDAERADDYFRSGMELLESGDTERAILQFRNAFEFEENHLEARTALGQVFLDQNNPGAAYGQFLRVAEQYPDEFEPRRILAELAFSAGNWDEFTRHGTVAVQLKPEEPQVHAIDLGMKYREAALAEDDPAREALAAEAEALLETLPESPILNNLLIDSYVRDGQLEKTLDRFAVLIDHSPDNRQLYIRRLAILGQLQDVGAIEARLQEMIERFPGDEEIQGMLFRFYVSQQRLGDAETFLRGLADPADEDPATFLSLVQFVAQTKGEEAARAEIERAIAVNPKPALFRGMLAMLDFQTGERDEAIAEMEAILAEADPAEDEAHTIKTNLARMLVATGNQVGARRHVEEVLAQNPSHVDALKMQASWQLQADEVDEAIANLRVALDTAPEDVQVMNLLAEAYGRLGEANLVRDYLAQAVEASGNAPEPSIRYARLLIQEERFLPAEDVLLPALRQSPGNTDILALLGNVYLQLEDMSRARQVIDTLRRTETDEGRRIANTLEAQVLSRESGVEQAMGFLESLATGEEAGLQERMMLIQARLGAGQGQEAQEMAEALVAENPDNLNLKQVLATTHLATGDLEAAKAGFRAVTDAAPEQAVSAWLQLIQLAQRQDDDTGSAALIEEALAATGNHPNVLWAKAGRLERLGDIDGAIEIYEELYAQNSSSVIIANNLASLLSTHRDDEESLERAWVVGRRLQGAENPALQDTYGWLLYQRGEYEAALPYLESAAQGMEDATVQAHLGFVYAALERPEEARTQLQKAVDAAGPVDTRPSIVAAREELARLRAQSDN